VNSRGLDCDNLRYERIIKKVCAFTLAEMLIAIGVIGVVAALALPTLITTIQEKVRARQTQVIETKLTKATTAMNIDGKIGPYYDSTEAFVNELSKYLKIVTVCKSGDLRKCWPYDNVKLEDGTEYAITNAKTGKAFKMNSDDTHDYKSNNIGIVTADGIPMIFSFNTKCEVLDPDMNYPWDKSGSTNATTNCIAGIIDINGSTPPNKFRTDVVAFHANGLGKECALEANGKCFGSVFMPTPLTKAQCEEQNSTLGIDSCPVENDYWAGAVAECGGVKNMPTVDDMDFLSNFMYGVPEGEEFNGMNIYFRHNSEFATALGFSGPNSSARAAIWTTPNKSFDDRNYYVFGLSFSGYLDMPGESGERNMSSLYGLCVLE
jgi:prepilin-type N-terminal cleavage/methylation domain-containing protein